MLLGEENKPELDDLVHFGVLGMKWGKRKGSDSSGGDRKAAKNARKIVKKEAQFEKQAATNKDLRVAILNHGMRNFDKHILPAINNKPEYRNGVEHDPALKKKYTRESIAALQKAFDDSARDTGYVNITGTRRLAVSLRSDGNWQLHTKEIEHSDSEIIINITRDSKGLITKISIPEDAFDQDDALTQGGMMDISEEEYFKHFGVMGMKWGRRKGGQGSSNSGKKKGSGNPYNPYTTSQHAKMVAGSAAVLGLMIMFGTSSSTRALAGPIAGRGAIGAKRVLELTGPTTLKAVKKGASGAYKISSL